MKFEEWVSKLVGKATTAVATVAKAIPPAAARPRDPFYSDDERKAEVNARRDGGRWIPRRQGWLR
jgi:hypothetical protein